MAVVPIKVPSVGESVSEGILSRWLKADGASIKAGEPLFELETDKASQPVPSPTAGVLKINVAEGTTVAVGATVGTIDTEAQAAYAPPEKPKSAPVASTPAPALKESAQVPPNGGTSVALSPAVRRLVTEEKVDPSRVEGTGRDGRITKGDVLTHLAASQEGTPATAEPTTPPLASPPPAAPPSRARPLFHVRRGNG